MLPFYYKKYKLMAVTIKIINNSTNEMPAYATTGAAGLDIRAQLTQAILLQPLERMLIPTGIFMEIPTGYEVQVRPRSGLAVKQGLTCLNTPGTIDSDYRGEVKVLLINLSNEVQKIEHADRIAQLVVAKVEQAILEEVNALTETDRGAGGFGHTGKK
jgi:dUTP pyrophosphatase